MMTTIKPIRDRTFGEFLDDVEAALLSSDESVRFQAVQDIQWVRNWCRGMSSSHQPRTLWDDILEWKRKVGQLWSSR